jgi:hypothetical protein
MDGLYRLPFIELDSPTARRPASDDKALAAAVFGVARQPKRAHSDANTGRKRLFQFQRCARFRSHAAPFSHLHRRITNLPHRQPSGGCHTISITLGMIDRIPWPTASTAVAGRSFPGPAGTDDMPANRSPGGDRPCGPRPDPHQARRLRANCIRRANAAGLRPFRRLGESRRVGHTAALLRRRSSGATGLIADTTGK